MIILQANEYLSLTVGSIVAYNVHCMVTYVDKNLSTGSISNVDRELSIFRGTSETTANVCSPPPANTIRNIKHINMISSDLLYNDTFVDGNTSVVILNKNTGAWPITLYATKLDAGCGVMYHEDKGFTEFNRQIYKPRAFITQQNSTYATTGTWTPIPNLRCTLEARSKYFFLFYGLYSTNATTTGAQFAVGMSKGVWYDVAVANMDTVTSSPTAAAVSMGFQLNTNTAITAQTTGPGTTISPGFTAGFIQTEYVEEDFYMMAMPEVTVANALVVYKGSWLRIWKEVNAQGWTHIKR